MDVGRLPGFDNSLPGGPSYYKQNPGIVPINPKGGGFKLAPLPHGSMPQGSPFHGPYAPPLPGGSGLPNITGLPNVRGGIVPINPAGGVDFYGAGTAESHDPSKDLSQAQIDALKAAQPTPGILGPLIDSVNGDITSIKLSAVNSLKTGLTYLVFAIVFLLALYVFISGTDAGQSAISSIKG